MKKLMSLDKDRKFRKEKDIMDSGLDATAIKSAV